MEVVQEDKSEGSMQCTIHPFKNSTPGGICAFCLQEKLGKLVSSSLPVAIFPSSSSSSSQSFRSDFGTTTTTTNTTNSSSLSFPPNGSSSSANYHSRRAKLPFLLTQRRKKKEAMMAAADSNSIVFKRSKSTTAPRNSSHFMNPYDSEDYSPHRKRFWSFLYLHSASKKPERPHKIDMSALGTTPINGGNLMESRERKKEELVIVDENESPDQARRVSRSRSVGCGSRSFSGDFFERISTGFGDCTLRRVESQREGKPRIHSMHRNSVAAASGQDCIKERVKCGGLFSNFIITSSSSSSSSSYLVSSNEDNFNGKTAKTPGSHHHLRNLAHARSKSWGWAFASPIRAFSKPSSGKREASTKNATPNLAAIPSLLVARG